MSLQYVKSEDIERYLRLVKLGENLSLDQLAAMANFFAEGAVTRLSNFLYEHIAENDCTLQHDLAQGCRCLCCREWQLVAEDGKTVVASAESMTEWVRKDLDAGQKKPG